ncbi:hypothetical protein D1007_34976 [Hordeum vulgare]|nr:hypothetical protein D1007_34976 [Hordeum vulgare]
MPRDLSRSPPRRRRPSPSPLRRGPGLRERVPSRSRSPYRPSYRRKSPSPSSPRRRRSPSPSKSHYKRKRSPSVTGSPVAKSSPHLGSTENKNAVDKQRLEEEKKRWGVSALPFRI